MPAPTSGQTTLQLGWTNPLIGAFGAHPVLGGPLNLNDGQTYTLLSPDGLELSTPRKTVIPTGNIRSQGERVTRATYRENREALARLILGPSSTYGQHIGTIRTLVSWMDASLAYPITLKWRPPGASSPVYLDVVASAHNVPLDESSWARLQVEPVELAFFVRPALRGDRVWLQNLAINPGFGAYGGPAVTVFNDPMANTNAYAGTGASAAASVLTIAAAAFVTFGSPGWGAPNAWTLRFQWITGLTGSFYLHYVNGSNFLRCVVSGTSLQLIHTIAGVSTTLATATIALVTGTFYWLTLTQYPTVAGNPPLVQATLYADSAGAKGAQTATIGPAATADAVTALSGRCALGASGAALAIGGAFSNVFTVSLFGPGGWTFTPNLSTATGMASGAWEQTLASTYPGGPTTSWGAGRVDLPPAGTVDCGWRLYAGGAPAGALGAMPVSAAGDVLQVAVWAKSSGLSANALLRLYVTEYDVNGAQLRQTLVTTLGGNQAAWVQLTGSVTTGASTVYADLMLRVVDTIAAGESANGTVWWDNAQVWDQTQTGIGGGPGGMPYCELRFPQSPAQLIVSGLLGDLPAPCMLALGTYVASMAVGTALNWALGRRGQASANGLLVGAPQGFQSPNTGSSVPATSAVLDASSYGGYYLATTLTSSGFNP
ncbi:MAG TPA: hypothetical protein VF808_08215, partial [Ktedonobacterales bacterium]